MSAANCSTLFPCNNDSNSTTSLSRPSLSQGLMLQFALSVVVLGNVVVLLALKSYKRWTSSDVLVCSLSTADILDSLVGLQLLTVMNFYLGAPWKRWTCKAYVTLLYTFRVASANTVTCMAAERAVLFVFPMKHHTMVTPLCVKKIAAGIWLLSFLLAALPLLGFGHSGFREKSQRCLIQLYDFGVRYAVLMEVYGLVLLILTLGSYVAIQLSTRKFIRRQASLGVQQTYKRREFCERPGREKLPTKRGRLERTLTGVSAVQRLNVMIGIVVLVYFISWLPFLLNNLVSLIIDKQPNLEISMFAGLISLLHALVNPILYGKMSQRYRHGYIYVLKTVLMVCGGERPVRQVPQPVVAPVKTRPEMRRKRHAADNPVLCILEIKPESITTLEEQLRYNTKDKRLQCEVKDVVDDIIEELEEYELDKNT